MKAVKKFKNLISRNDSSSQTSMIGGAVPIVKPPQAMSPRSPSEESPMPFQQRSKSTGDTSILASSNTAHGPFPLVQDSLRLEDNQSISKMGSGQNEPYTPSVQSTALSSREPSSTNQSSFETSSAIGTSPINTEPGNERQKELWRPSETDKSKEQIRDSNTNQPRPSLFPPYLGIGSGSAQDESDRHERQHQQEQHSPSGPGILSESPPATDIDIYETAYHEEVQRIRSDRSRRKGGVIYLTRRVEEQAHGHDGGGGGNASEFAKWSGKSAKRDQGEEQERRAKAAWERALSSMEEDG